MDAVTSKLTVHVEFPVTEPEDKLTPLLPESAVTTGVNVPAVHVVEAFGALDTVTLLGSVCEKIKVLSIAPAFAELSMV